MPVSHHESRPALSIIVPIYNQAPYLRKCLDSLLALELAPEEYELVLVNDGSTDQSAAICQEYIQREGARIRLISQGNRGVSAARNRGMHEAKGELIAFVDGDDWVEPWMFTKMLAVMKERPQIHLACCGIRCETEDGQRRYTLPALPSDRLLSAETAFGFMMDGSYLRHYPVGKIYRLDAMHTCIFPEDMKLGEDLIFSIDFFEHLTGPVAYFRDEGYHYVMREGSASQGGLVEREFLGRCFVETQRLHEAMVRSEDPWKREVIARFLYRAIYKRLMRLFLIDDRAESYADWIRTYQAWLRSLLEEEHLLERYDKVAAHKGELRFLCLPYEEAHRHYHSYVTRLANALRRARSTYRHVYICGTGAIGCRLAIVNAARKLGVEAFVAQDTAMGFLEALPIRSFDEILSQDDAAFVIGANGRRARQFARGLAGLGHHHIFDSEGRPFEVAGNVFAKPQGGQNMIVYGTGAHLQDMLSWHPDLAGKITRIFDKDPKKIGTTVPGTEVVVEAPSALKALPTGTQVAISALRYYDEIVQELHALNPGLVCPDIDEAYDLLAFQPKPFTLTQPKPEAKTASAHSSSNGDGLSNLQRQRLRGRDAAARWRQRLLMECASRKRVFWGVHGVRATYLRRQMMPLMGRGDIFIDEDRSLRGQVVDGLPVCLPEVLKDIEGKFLIIVLSADYPAVRERLMDYGYVENVDFVEGRQLLGEDEHGWFDVPCVDKVRAGMIVYGLGAHLTDMLKWHPVLAKHITRIIDKDPKKLGQIVPQVGVRVEPPEVLRDLPSGTEVAVSAIRYLGEIQKDIHALQPGLICRNIDAVWQEYVEHEPPKPPTSPKKPAKHGKEQERTVQAKAKKLPEKYDAIALRTKYIGESEIDAFCKEVPEEGRLVLVGWGADEQYVWSHLCAKGRQIASIAAEDGNLRTKPGEPRVLSFEEAAAAYPDATYIIATHGRCYEKQAALMDLGIGTQQFCLRGEAFISRYRGRLPKEHYADVVAAQHYAINKVYPDLKHPKTLNEKIMSEMIKVPQQKSKSLMADKYEVYNILKKKIGEKYLIPVLGEWSSFDEIDFSTLPESYVLKTNHGCGYNIMVNKEHPLNKTLAKAEFDDWMKTNFAYLSYEMQYEVIEPKILCEPYIEGMIDYDIHCFHGNPNCMIVYTNDGVHHHEAKTFDTEWNEIYFRTWYPDFHGEMKKPAYLKEMLSLTKELSADYPYVRVDWYGLKDGTFKFGEMTFTTGAGHSPWRPSEWDKKLGDLW